MGREDRSENNALSQQSGSWDRSWSTPVAEVQTPLDGNWQIPNWIPGPILDSLPVTEAYRSMTLRGSSHRGEANLDKSVYLAEYVERSFVPEYVSTKRASGRAHFQATLKHVLSPERVAHAFGANPDKSSARLKAISGWPYMDSLRLSDVNQESIQRLITAALKAGYSTQTATHIRNVIRTIFSQAIRSGSFDGPNPATYVKLPAMSRRETHALTLSQLKQVMQWMRYPEKEIALFALLAEMNVAEICGLQWKYVNLSNESHLAGEDHIPPRTIAIRKQSYRGEFGPVVGTRKRFIPLPELLYSTLQQLKHRKTSTSPDDFVVASRTGTPIYPDNIAARRLKWIGTTLEIPWLSWHVFHRTRTKLMTEFGRHLNKELEKILPLNPAEILPSRGALKGETRTNQKIDHCHTSRSANNLVDRQRRRPVETQSEFATAMAASSILSSHDARPEGSSLCMALFIETKFIPDHVEHKSFAGRTHYQAILKHILKPETVERMFTPYMGAWLAISGRRQTL